MQILETDVREKIGIRIRSLRVNQNRTVEEVATASGLSKSMISKIENNKAIPSVAALVKIASSLGVNVSDLLEKDDELLAEMTTKAAVQNNFTYTDKGYSIFPFAANVHHKKMQPFIFKARKGEVREHKLSHDGEEFIYVIEGALEFTVGSIKYQLKAGDSLYFNSVEKHGMMPISEEVIYLDIFT